MSVFRSSSILALVLVCGLAQQTNAQTGACCLPSGACTTTTPLGCGLQIGSYQGDNTSCASAACSGACCRIDGTCADVGALLCQTGNFSGLGTSCADIDCFFGACCLPDKACTELTNFECAPFGGDFRGDGTTCQTDCPLPQGTGFAYQGQLKETGRPVERTVDMRFSLWLSSNGDQQVGPTLLMESVLVQNGLFTVDLDFGVDAFNGNGRWLEIEICPTTGCALVLDAFVVLTPRQPLLATPYALQTRGIVVNGAGDVGIGTKMPSNKLSVLGNADFSGNVGIQTATPTAPLTVNGLIKSMADGIEFPDGTTQTSAAIPSPWDTSGPDISFSNGNVGINTTSPTAPLTVNGLIKSQAGGIEFSDGTTQTSAPTPSPWTKLGADISYSAGKVGIGTGNTAPSNALTISSSDANTLRLLGPSAFSRNGARLSFGSGNFAFIEHDPNSRLVIRSQNGVSFPNFVRAPFVVSTDSGSSNDLNIGIPDAPNLFGFQITLGLQGASSALILDATETWTMGTTTDRMLRFAAGNRYVARMDTTSDCSGNQSGIFDVLDSADDWEVRLDVVCDTGITMGRFRADQLLVPGKFFQIDHPLDPANKYLYHACVESPDMKNIYDGTVTTDEAGKATVQLPSYFEALNRDFRYQLTAIGQFAQAIVASEVQDKQFTIKTNKPNVKVSWQVTGVRQDAFARAISIRPEMDKVGLEKGRYMHPTLFGKSKDLGIGAIPRMTKTNTRN